MFARLLVNFPATSESEEGRGWSFHDILVQDIQLIILNSGTIFWDTLCYHSQGLLTGGEHALAWIFFLLLFNGQKKDKKKDDCIDRQCECYLFGLVGQCNSLNSIFGMINLFIGKIRFKSFHLSIWRWCIKFSLFN